MDALVKVKQARKRRDLARRTLASAQDAFIEAIIEAAALGCSTREISERAGVSFQRIHRVIQDSESST
jgi:DNA-directed RNA polymerase specialized sigma24 family protein